MFQVFLVTLRRKAGVDPSGVLSMHQEDLPDK